MGVAVTSQVIEEQYREAVEEEVPQCKHHWVIESPQGATSAGRCKVCGEIREFRNSAADTLWRSSETRICGLSRMRSESRFVSAGDLPASASSASTWALIWS